MKLIGYVRVSTGKQARNGVSIDAQIERIRAYATFKGADLVEIYVDRGKSGKSFNHRPNAREAITRVLAGEADALIVYKQDRISRSALGALKLIHDLHSAGRDFISLKEDFDTSTPYGRLAMTMLAGFAQFERELARERTLDAVDYCIESRRVYSDVPFGFARDGKKLVEDPAEIAVVKTIGRRREAGIAYQKIANELNEGGVSPKRGSKWFASAVRSVFLTASKLSVL